MVKFSLPVTGRSYTQIFLKVQYIIIQAILSRKSTKKFAVTDEKYSRLLTVENRTSTLLGKGCQHGEEDFKNKILS